MKTNTKVDEKNLTDDQLKIAFTAMSPHIRDIIKRENDYDFFIRVANELHARGFDLADVRNEKI